ALDEGVENGLSQRFERTVVVVAEVPAIVGLLLPLTAGEAGLQQEVGELVEEGLEIDRVGHLRAELRVGMESHEASCPKNTSRRLGSRSECGAGLRTARIAEYGLRTTASPNSAPQFAAFRGV